MGLFEQWVPLTTGLGILAAAMLCTYLAVMQGLKRGGYYALFWKLICGLPLSIWAGMKFAELDNVTGWSLTSQETVVLTIGAWFFLGLLAVFVWLIILDKLADAEERETYEH